MASICTSNVTSGFIDLATFDELEKYMYGGPDATAYFVRETRKSTWFTQVPVVLSRASGNANFDTEWSVSISRAGDYLLSTWLRVTIPEVVPNPATCGDVGSSNTLRLRWTRNFMHNLVAECCITFNDLVAARFDNYHLDFWAAFTVPAGKRTGYNNMIGNITQLTDPHGNGIPNAGNNIPSMTLNLPLPFWYSRDSGVALPTAALPYNDMRLNFSFRNWDQLLIKDDISLANNVRSVCATTGDLETPSNMVLSNVQVWANYAIVSNDERKRMACAPRDILIEQVQTAPRQTFAPNTVLTPRYDIRFSHAIKVFFFGVRNKTLACAWSNYTAGSPIVSGATVSYSINPAMRDPILATSLIYENTQRLSNMGSDYFSLVNPWYCAPVIPVETGYHMYSYSLDFICLDPMGSTNYGKLTNVSIAPTGSQAAVDGAAGTGQDPNDSQATWVQHYEFIVTCINNNIIRISGGALGFPVL
jgi:hypothetical protein